MSSELTLTKLDSSNKRLGKRLFNLRAIRQIHISKKCCQTTIAFLGPDSATTD